MLRCGTAGSARIKNGAHSGGQKGVSVWKKYRAWDGAQPFETVLRTKNGEWVQLNVTCGEDNGYDLFCFSRTTGLCGRIEQYEERLAQSEEESRSKTTFLSRMSHEIRTPMNGMIGMLALVLLTAGQLGLHMTSGSRAITRRAVAWALEYRRCYVPVRDGADTHVPAVECGTQTAQNVDRGASAVVAEADVQADFPLGNGRGVRLGDIGDR